jgi:hypothetical protein
MSKLSALTGKPKTYTVGELELELKPRKLKDLDLLFALQDKAQQTQALTKLITVTLKEAVPDATDEEIDQVAFEHFQVLVEAILDVNGMSDGLRESNTEANKEKE